VLSAAGQGDYMQASAGGPAVTILGTVAMAPQDLGNVASRFNNDLVKGNLDHPAMLYWGQVAAQRNLELSDVFSDSAIPVIRQLMQNKCIHELSASLADTYGQAAAIVLRPTPRNALAIVQGMKHN